MSNVIKMPGMLKVFRQSGLPIDLTQYKAYQDEYVQWADKIGERAKLDMFKSQRMYRFIEYLLKKKYTSMVEISLPRTKSAYKDLIIQYGTPITLALTADGNDLIGLLLDEM